MLTSNQEPFPYSTMWVFLTLIYNYPMPRADTDHPQSHPLDYEEWTYLLIWSGQSEHSAYLNGQSDHSDFLKWLVRAQCLVPSLSIHPRKHLYSRTNFSGQMSSGHPSHLPLHTTHQADRYIWPLPYTQSLSTLHPLIPVAQSFRGRLSNCKTLLILPLASALASIMTYCLAENKVT